MCHIAISCMWVQSRHVVLDHAANVYIQRLFSMKWSDDDMKSCTDCTIVARQLLDYSIQVERAII